MTFAADFAMEYTRISIQNAMADVVIKLVEVGDISPYELEQSIRTNWSLVDFLMGQPDASKFLSSVPSVMGLTKYSELLSGPKREVGQDLVKALVAREIAQTVAKKAPTYGEVLLRHLDWVQGEMRKAQSLVGIMT